MNPHPELGNLSELRILPINTCLTRLVAPIAEVYPACGPCQQIRVAVDSASIDVFIFDRSPIQVSMIGMVLVATASPNAKNALVVEPSKAYRSPNPVRAIALRRRAQMEIVSRQDLAANAQSMGFSQAIPSIAHDAVTAVAPAATVGVSPAPIQAVQLAPTDYRSLENKPISAVGVPSSAELSKSSEITARALLFSQCLAESKRTMPTASDEDVRFAANSIFVSMITVAA